MEKNTLLNFIEKQEILDNLNVTLRKMYEDDVEFNDQESIDILTDRTFKVMEYMENIRNGLMDDPGIITVADAHGIPPEQVVIDVAEIMLMSTVARQTLTLERLTSGD